jgi:hypothetical protein
LFVFGVWVMLQQQQRIIKNCPQDSPSFLHTPDEPLIWDSRTSKAKQDSNCRTFFKLQQHIVFSIACHDLPSPAVFWTYNTHIFATISEAYLFLAALPGKKGGKKNWAAVYLFIYLSNSFPKFLALLPKLLTLPWSHAYIQMKT